VEIRLDPQARQRIGELTSQLTLDLFLQQGVFWNEVTMIRKGLGIVPTCRLPPPYRDDLSTVFESVRGTSSTTAADIAEGVWDKVVELLHTRCIPESHYIGGAEASQRAWSFFLAPCLLYDPPKDSLLAFAHCGDASLLTVTPVSDQQSSWLGAMITEAARTDASGSPFTMRPPDPIPPTVGVKIVAYRDTEAVVNDMLHYWSAFLIELNQRHLQPYGLQLAEVMRDLGERVPSVKNWHDYPSELAIVVTSDTSKNDLLRAFHAIPPAQGAPRKATRRHVDPLAALQCAIWHDDYKLTYPVIADKMGWTLSMDEYQKKRRSETARTYVKHGRRLRAQQKAVT
jgi:hypothetical protein